MNLAFQKNLPIIFLSYRWVLIELTEIIAHRLLFCQIRCIRDFWMDVLPAARPLLSGKDIAAPVSITVV